MRMPTEARKTLQLVANLRASGLLEPGSFTGHDLRDIYRRRPGAFSMCERAAERGAHTSLRWSVGTPHYQHWRATREQFQRLAGDGYRFSNSGGRAEMILYGDIDPTRDDQVSARQVAHDLARLGAVPLAVRVNSMGGCPHDSLAIHNALARHPARVDVVVDGVAASGASVIAMAGDEIRMASNALMMIHDPQGTAWGDAAEMRKSADRLDLLRDQGIDIYAGRSGQPRAVVDEWMSDETWFTANDAVASGLAHAVA